MLIHYNVTHTPAHSSYVSTKLNGKKIIIFFSYLPIHRPAPLGMHYYMPNEAEDTEKCVQMFVCSNKYGQAPYNFRTPKRAIQPLNTLTHI